MVQRPAIAVAQLPISAGVRVKQRQDEQAAILCPGLRATHLVVRNREGSTLAGRAARDHDVHDLGPSLPTLTDEETAHLQRKGAIKRESQHVQRFGRHKHGGHATTQATRLRECLAPKHRSDA
jgi:hypothetical protein